MIRRLQTGVDEGCAAFLDRASGADYSHDPAWIDIIRETYGRETFLLAYHDEPHGPVRGIAAAAWLESPLGRQLVCLPFLDYGGPIAEDASLHAVLLDALLAEAATRKASLEIRSREPLPGLVLPRNEKVGMILRLNGGDQDAYWKSLDAKVRNQVRKAEKSAVKVEWGREDKLPDFYRVFCQNMRDLGSPVHSSRLFVNVLRRFSGAEVGVAYREGRCIGGLFRILWKDALVIPWASTLREERIHSPNNAMYWESIRFAFEKGCSQVDFGRSSKDEGTYKFKKQWLAEERPLCWYPFDATGKQALEVTHAASGKLKFAQSLWTRLPLTVANALGPRIRGYISA